MDSKACDVDSDGIDEIIVANYTTGKTSIMILNSDGSILSKGIISGEVLVFSIGHFVDNKSYSIAALTVTEDLYLAENISTLDFTLKMILNSYSYLCVPVYDRLSGRDLLAVSDTRGLFLDLSIMEFITSIKTPAEEVVVYNKSIGAIFVNSISNFILIIPHISEPFREIYAEKLVVGDFNSDGKNDIAYCYIDNLHIKLADKNPPKLLDININPENPTFVDDISITIKAYDESLLIFGTLYFTEPNYDIKIYELGNKQFTSGYVEMQSFIGKLWEGSLEIHLSLYDSWANTLEYTFTIDIYGLLWETYDCIENPIDSRLDSSGLLVIANSTHTAVINITSNKLVSITNRGIMDNGKIVATKFIGNELVTVATDGTIIIVFDAFSGMDLIEPLECTIPLGENNPLLRIFPFVTEIDDGIAVAGKKFNPENGECYAAVILIGSKGLTEIKLDSEMILAVAPQGSNIAVLATDYSGLFLKIFDWSSNPLNVYSFLDIGYDINLIYELAILDNLIICTMISNDRTFYETKVYNITFDTLIPLFDDKAIMLMNPNEAHYALLGDPQISDIIFINETVFIRNPEGITVDGAKDVLMTLDVDGDGFIDFASILSNVIYFINGKTLELMFEVKSPILYSQLTFNGIANLYQYSATCTVTDAKVYLLSSPYLYHVMNIDVIAPENVHQGDDISFIIKAKSMKGNPISGLSVTLRLFREDTNFEKIVTVPEESPGVYSISLASENFDMGTYKYEVIVESSYYFDRKIEGSFEVTGDVLISVYPNEILVEQGDTTWIMVFVYDAFGNEVDANLTAILSGNQVSVKKADNGFNVTFKANLKVGKHLLMLMANTKFGTVSKAVTIIVTSMPNITLISKQTFIQNESIELKLLLKDSLGNYIDNASIVASFAGGAFNLLYVGEGIYRAEISPVGIRGGTYTVTISVAHEYLKSTIITTNITVISILQLSIQVSKEVTQGTEIKAKIIVRDIYG